MPAPPPPATGARIAPGTVLAAFHVTTDTGTMGLAAQAAAEALRPLADTVREIRTAHLAVRPGAHTSASARQATAVHGEALVTAVLDTPGGTLAEVDVALTSTARTDPSRSPSEVIGSLELSILTDLPAPSEGAAPGSPRWGVLLEERLRTDSAFTDLIEAYDGTIGLRIGGRELHIRCYRGTVLEVSPRSVGGADFVVDIGGAEFLALMTRETNAFMEAAMMRRVSSAGSGYEYLRMTGALIRIIDLARRLAAEDGWGHPGAKAVPAPPAADRNGAPA
ncbi:hypothetical protein [Brevibacterium album]|uniref:hypothetical protein n=1 Tax=Brevibacterium album TaxID=417948 RepID=UPI000429EE42|nr:hypothetical protein [Brevibacterium album]